MTAILILCFPSIVVSAICSYVLVRRVSVSWGLTLLAGSLSASLSTVAVSTGQMLVGPLWETRVSRQPEKLTPFEGWLVLVTVYGGATLIAGFIIALFCLVIFRSSLRNSRREGVASV